MFVLFQFQPVYSPANTRRQQLQKETFQEGEKGVEETGEERKGEIVVISALMTIYNSIDVNTLIQVEGKTGKGVNEGMADKLYTGKGF